MPKMVRENSNGKRVKTKKQIDKEKDREWSVAVRQRDKFQCQWCKHDGKKRAGNQPHHIIPRARGKAVRHDIRNGVTLCFYCHHRRLIEDPVGFSRFIEKFLAKQGTSYDELSQLSKQTVKGGTK